MLTVYDYARIRTTHRKGFAYRATLMDRFSRRIVGWSVMMDIKNEVQMPDHLTFSFPYDVPRFNFSWAIPVCQCPNSASALAASSVSVVRQRKLR